MRFGLAVQIVQSEVVIRVVRIVADRLLIPLPEGSVALSFSVIDPTVDFKLISDDGQVLRRSKRIYSSLSFLSSRFFLRCSLLFASEAKSSTAASVSASGITVLLSGSSAQGQRVL